jgi:uncharacterized membrane protein
MEQNPTNPPAQPAGEDKTAAIVAYLTLVGFIVAIVLHGQKKTALGTFHLRQMLGIIITSLAMYILIFIPILGWLAMIALGLLNFIVWIMGLIAAVNGEMKPGPILGKTYQNWFKNAFN